MNWQDLVLGVGSIVFVLALVPSILGPHKPALSTSIITTLVLVAFSVVYGSLHFWYAFTVNCIDIVGWMILAWQKNKV